MLLTAHTLADEMLLTKLAKLFNSEPLDGKREVTVTGDPWKCTYIAFDDADGRVRTIQPGTSEDTIL
jgi:hypothetical protein